MFVGSCFSHFRNDLRTVFIPAFIFSSRAGTFRAWEANIDRALGERLATKYKGGKYLVVSFITAASQTSSLQQYKSKSKQLAAFVHEFSDLDPLVDPDRVAQPMTRAQAKAAIYICGRALHVMPNTLKGDLTNLNREYALVHGHDTKALEGQLRRKLMLGIKNVIKATTKSKEAYHIHQVCKAAPRANPKSYKQISAVVYGVLCSGLGTRTGEAAGTGPAQHADALLTWRNVFEFKHKAWPSKIPRSWEDWERELVDPHHAWFIKLEHAKHSGGGYKVDAIALPGHPCVQGAYQVVAPARLLARRAAIAKGKKVPYHSALPVLGTISRGKVVALGDTKLMGILEGFLKKANPELKKTKITTHSGRKGWYTDVTRIMIFDGRITPMIRNRIVRHQSGSKTLEETYFEPTIMDKKIWTDIIWGDWEEGLQLHLDPDTADVLGGMESDRPEVTANFAGRHFT